MEFKECNHADCDTKNNILLEIQLKQGRIIDEFVQDRVSKKLYPNIFNINDSKDSKRTSSK